MEGGQGNFLQRFPVRARPLRLPPLSIRYKQVAKINIYRRERGVICMLRNAKNKETKAGGRGGNKLIATRTNANRLPHAKASLPAADSFPHTQALFSLTGFVLHTQLHTTYQMVRPCFLLQTASCMLRLNSRLQTIYLMPRPWSHLQTAYCMPRLC